MGSAFLSMTSIGFTGLCYEFMNMVLFWALKMCVSLEGKGLGM